MGFRPHTKCCFTISVNVCFRETQRHHRFAQELHVMFAPILAFLNVEEHGAGILHHHNCFCN